jgi:hypothetical protein
MKKKSFSGDLNYEANFPFFFLSLYLPIHPSLCPPACLYDILNMYLKCIKFILLCINHMYTLCSSRLSSVNSHDEHRERERSLLDKLRGAQSFVNSHDEHNGYM